MKELGRQMKNHDFKKCYLFWGEETYLKKLYEDRMKSAIIDKSAVLMNYSVYEGKKISVSDIIDMAQTQPFLSEKRVLLVKNSGLFQTGRKDETEKMTAYVSNIAESTCIIFSEEEVDKRGKLYKAVSKEGYVVEFKPMAEKDLISWIVKKLQKKHIQIEAGTAAYLVRFVGGDMNSLMNEMIKLSDYCSGTKIVKSADIDTVCIKAFEVKIFDLVAAIGNHKPEIALEIYHNLLLLKESPIMILAMITRQFRLILQCKALLEIGEVQASICQRLGQRDFIVRECLKQSRNFSLNQLKEAMQDCLTTDISIKTGKMSQEMAVELLLLKYGN